MFTPRPTTPAQKNRLDFWVSQTFDIPRSVAKTLIAEGKVTLNGVVTTKASTLVSDPTTLQAEIPKISSRDLVPEKRYLDFLYEDADLLILNKPMGLTVHPAGKRTGTLVNALLHYPKTLSELAGKDRPGIVHRLDRDTEGLMIIAKTDAAYLHLRSQFQNRTVEKKYYAIVHGEPRQDEFLIDHPISRHPSKHNQMTAKNTESAKDALTKVQVIKRMSSTSLCIARPLTGRTHQIRVHLAAVGHPVMGDPLYTSKKQKKTAQKLQAFFLKFQHPTSGLWMSFELPLTWDVDLDHHKQTTTPH